MLADSNLPVMFWNEAIYAACYTLNCVLTVKKFGKTSYELLHRRKLNLEYLEPFGAPCTMLNPSEKFSPKAEEGYFVGYATPLKRVFNKRTRQVEDWANVEVQRYTQNLQGTGPDWMFDYKDFFESFNLDSLVEEAVIRLLYECENATTSPLMRPITVNPPPASNDTSAPIQEEEMFKEASTSLDTSESEDEQFEEAVLENAEELEEKTVNPTPNPDVASSSNTGHDQDAAENLTAQTVVERKST